MTIPSTLRRAGPFTGTGVLVSYPFTFKVFAASDLLVAVSDTNGLETILVLDSGYSVSLSPDQDATPGGSVTYAVGGVSTALPAGYKLTITGGGLPLDQPADLPNGGNFSPIVVENALDRLEMQIQNQAVELDRTLQTAITSPVSLALPAPVAGQLLGWNMTLDGLVNYAPDASSAAGLQIRLANPLSVVDGDAMLAVIQPLTGAQARTQHDRNLDTINLMDFIPISERAAIRNFTSVTNLATYINAAFAVANGRRLIVPAGLYNHSELQVPKAVKLMLEGDFASYDSTEGSVFKYTGAGIGLQVGVDDGNPDVTGPARGCKISRIHFTTTTGTTAIRLQNTALAEIEYCETRGFSGKVFDLRANVITRLVGAGIAGTQGAGGVGSGSYGIWCDDQYFGNYVVDIEHCHIFQLNHAGRFTEGRSLNVFNNIVENIRPGAAGGVWELSTSGYISLAAFTWNYYENHRGYLYEGSGFTGAILQLVVKNEDGWGSADAGNVNPGVGNLPRTKVFATDIGGNNFVDSSLNTQAALALPSVYPSTSVFDTATTKVLANFGNREYEDDIVYALQTAELMKSAGDFAGITGGTPGTLAVGGSTQPSNNGAAASAPFGWTQVISGAVWNAVIDNILGSWICYTPGSGSTFNLATYTQTLTPIATTRYFVVGFTSRGWSSLKLGAGSIYDSGASITAYHTEVVKFSVAPSAANFTLTLATNATASHWAEMRLYEIGSAEFNEPGALNAALTKAVKRLMRRGAY